jgi:hypothetical protein
VNRTIEPFPNGVCQWGARLNAFGGETLFFCTRQEGAVSATNIEKPEKARASFALLTRCTQVTVDMAGDFLIDSFEVKVISRALIRLVHLPDAFGSVSDVEKYMTAARATDYTVVAHLKEEFGIVEATGPASMPNHGG